MGKVQRSKLAQMLNWKETPDLQLQTCISIVNMGLLWRLASTSTEDRENNDDSPFTEKDYSSKLFNMIRMRHPRVKPQFLPMIFMTWMFELKIQSMIGAMQKYPILLVRKASERMMQFHPVRISMPFLRISQTRFAFNSS